MLYPRLDTLLWLIATLILVALPHFSHVLLWIPPIFLGLLLWRYQITRKQKQLPSQKLLFAIALVIFVALLFRSGLGRNGYVALLIVLSGIKLLEMNRKRDALLICFLSYFLIITNFLYSQSIPTALYMGLVMLVATATLISINDNRLSTRQRLRLSGVLLLQALPVMFILFVLFPRVAGPFWKLPIDTHSGVTGLSDSMAMGTVNQLSLSNEIAFRVKFDGEIPPTAKRYWRGPVLSWTNGRNWKRGFEQRFVNQKLNLHTNSQPYDYTITLEPHNRRWLFALDLPSQVPLNAKIDFYYQLLANSPVRERKRYKLRSYTDYRADIITKRQYQTALRLPRGKHYRARALAATWRQENPQPEAIIQRALQYFNQAPFVYTHTPELLLDDPVDEFLFETREGFCEHYAAAFTILMRAAGIPARVVTGYLGGTINPIDGYLIVRQRDAHAWSEVWLANKGWVRIDPTSAVAPERVEQGIESALPTAFNPLGLDINFDQDSSLAKIWQQLQNSWDAINNGWNQWVLGYGPTRQAELLKKLGFKDVDWRGMTILLVIIIATILFSYAIWMFLRPYSRKSDPAQQFYLRFCKKLAQRGLTRHLSEGPLDFANRVGLDRPDLAHKIQQIVEIYLQIRYRSKFQRLTELRIAVRHFRP
jgi:transglutaminase-like putative cysteine protease